MIHPTLPASPTAKGDLPRLREHAHNSRRDQVSPRLSSLLVERLPSQPTVVTHPSHPDDIALEQFKIFRLGCMVRDGGFDCSSEDVVSVRPQRTLATDEA